jgi:uncharacterized membrane protein
VTPTAARLGLRANAAQFWLLVAVNAFVGAMVGLERSTLPLVGRADFGLGSSAAVLAFIVAFGVAKALLGGLALGLNEAAGYGGVALAAGLSGWLAGSFAARDVLVVAGAAIAVTGLLGYSGAIALVAGLTAASGLWVLVDMPRPPATAERPLAA